MPFADKLRFHRTNNKLTQGELAKKIGVSQKTISSWETGRSEPTMKELTALCDVFDCTMADISDTRERKTGEITLDDIYARIKIMSFSELSELESVIHERMQTIEQISRMEKEKEELERKIKEMQTRIDTLEKRKFVIGN